MGTIYIADHYYCQLAEKNYTRPKTRFLAYYDDLYAMEEVNDYYTEDSYMNSHQYTYAELGKSVLEQCFQKHNVCSFDLIVVSYSGHEYDPDHAFGAYFCNLYGIQCRMFDICDQGIISPFTAMKIIQAYMNQNSIRKAMLLCLDQPAIPVEAKRTHLKPVKSSARIMICESRYSESALFGIDNVEVEESDIMGMNVEAINRHHNSAAEVFSELFNFSMLNNNKEKISLSVVDPNGLGSAQMEVSSFLTFNKPLKGNARKQITDMALMAG